MPRPDQGIGGRVRAYQLNSEPPPRPRALGGRGVGERKRMQVPTSCCGLSHTG